MANSVSFSSGSTATGLSTNLTLEIEEGRLPRRALNLVLDWAELHRDELLNDWDKCRKHAQPDKIEPLP